MQEQHKPNETIMEKNYNIELMRSQMADFKQQLEKQNIVNDLIIAKSMRSKMSWIKRLVISEIIALPLILIVFIAIKYAYDLSWWGIGTFYALALFDTWFDYRTNVQCMKDTDYSRDNLIYTMQKLVNMKQRRGVEMGIMTPATILSALAIGMETSDSLTAHDASEHEWLLLYCGGIGLIIGIIAALFIYRRMQKTNDELIRQIEELTEEE